MLEGAARIRQPGQSADQAFARYIETPEGMTVYRCYKAADGRDWSPNADEPAPRNAYEMLERARAEHVRKAEAARGDRAARHEAIEHAIRGIADGLMAAYPERFRTPAAAMAEARRTPKARAMLAGQSLTDRALAGHPA